MSLKPKIKKKTMARSNKPDTFLKRELEVVARSGL